MGEGQGQGEGGIAAASSPAREVLARGDFVEARRLAGDDEEILGYLKPDRAAIVLAALCLLLLLPIAIYYLFVR